MRVLNSQRQGAKKPESAVENTVRNDTVANIGVRTAVFKRASFTEAFKRVLGGEEPKSKRSRVIAGTRITRSQHKSKQSEVDNAKVAAKIAKSRGAALVAQAKIRSFYTNSPERDLDLDGFHDDVDEAVVNRGLHSLHSLTLRNLQEDRKQESSGTRNVNLPPPKLPKLSNDQMKPSWISIEALEKIRESEAYSNQYSKTVPKPVVLLPAPFQHEEPPPLQNSAQYQASPSPPQDIELTIELQPSVPSVPRQKTAVNRQRCFSPDITDFRS